MLLVVVLPAAHRSTQPSAPLNTIASTSAPGDVSGIGIDVVEQDGDLVRIVGWVSAPEPANVAVMVDPDLVSLEPTEVVAMQGRPDRDAAGIGDTSWGFSISLTAPDATRVCVVAGTEEACRPVGCDPALFPSSFAADLEALYPGQRFTANVVDTRTGCSYDLRPEARLTTASVVKLEVLAVLLHQAQARDTDLTAFERSQAEAMMRYSLNPETVWVLGHVGGTSTIQAHSNGHGLASSRHVPAFGRTISSAGDRTQVVLEVLAGEGGLGEWAVEQAFAIMADGPAGQQWGISAGVSAGYAATEKNGFYPDGVDLWRVGSSGFVSDPGGGGYAVTIMTAGNTTQLDGVELVESIATHVARALTATAPGPRSFDEVECVTAGGGESWTQLARAIGLDSGDAATVRLHAGGDGPLFGQLVCTPGPS